MKIVNLGHVQVIAGPSPSIPSGSASSRPPSSKIMEESTPVASLDELRRLVDFQILQPAWLPSPEMRLRRVQQVISHSDVVDRVVAAMLNYSTRTEAQDAREGLKPWVTVRQLSMLPSKMMIGGNIEKTHVGGQAAVVYADKGRYRLPANLELSMSFCFFEHRNLLILLYGPNLSAATLVRAGESLG